MRLFESVRTPEGAHLAQLLDDVLLGLAAPGDLLEDRTPFLRRIGTQDPERVDPVEQQIVEAVVAVVVAVPFLRALLWLIGRYGCPIAHRGQGSACVAVLRNDRPTCFNVASGGPLTKGETTVKNFVKEFKDFIATGNMIELAVAVILGGVIGAAITSFTEDILMNVVAAIFGKPDFAGLTFTIGKGVIKYGNFINALIALVITGLVLFMLIKAYNKMRKPIEVAPPGPNEIDLLTEIRDALRARS